MHENEYAYGVARVRANELTLLSPADTEQLITADSYETALRLLSDKGWQVPSTHDYAPMLETQLQNAWQLLSECAPDVSLLEALIIFNDFHNLKAALKAKFSDLPAQDYVITPSVYDPAEIIETVDANEFENLPECMRDCAVKAYDAIVRLESGRLADTAIDRAALISRLELSKKSESELLEKVAELSVAAADIKTAIRCAAAGRSAEYIEDAVCGCDLFSKTDMISAAMESQDALADFLRTTPLSSLADSIEISIAEFEKQCDDLTASYITQAKYTSFGPDPLVAYYIARQTEVKNVRIILSAKLNGFAVDTIRARVREVYA